MYRCKSFVKLMRPKHYLKNGLIFVPLFFDLNFSNIELLENAILGFIVFSFLASIIYIINDLNDIESDRNSETKSKRPLASGIIKKQEAIVLAVILLLIIIIIAAFMDCKGIEWIILYFILNIAYSLKLKHLPIIDVAILASGFLLRLLYGAAITDISISFWLCITVISFSFYMGLGKRRGELSKNNPEDVREVLKYYNTSFLDSNMYMCLGLAITFYALWAGDEKVVSKFGSDMQIWTVPIVMIIAMKYSLDIEKSGRGDPIEVILGDKWLILMVVIYAILMCAIIYF